MKKTDIILLATLFCCMFLSCKKDNGGGAYDKAFTKDNTVRMEVAHEEILRYDSATCQESFNRKNSTFCVGTDTMSDFFSLDLSSLPTEEGQTIISSLMWTTPSDIQKEESVAFEVIKLEGDRVWLWDSANSIGIVVRFLF